MNLATPSPFHVALPSPAAPRMVEAGPKMTSETKSIDVEGIYRTHASMVLRRATVLLGSEQDAREVLHDVFVGLLASPEQFAGKSQVSTWLYTVTTNRCLNRIRNRLTQSRLLDLHVTTDAETTTRARGENVAVIRDLLDRVPEEVALAAVYYYVDEMNREEIARLLGRSVRHVANLLARLDAAVSVADASPPPRDVAGAGAGAIRAGGGR